MTVVVPPSKSSKQPAPAADAEGDVAMDVDKPEEKVDPAVQAVAGERTRIRRERLHPFL